MTMPPALPTPPPDGPPLTIGLLSFEYPAETGFGGIGTYTWHHARALAALGHRVHVLAGAKAPTALRTEVHDGVQVHRYWADGRVMQACERLGGFKLWWTRQRLQNAWSMYHGIRALHRTHRFDVLEMPECGAEGALVTRLLGVPTVVKLHSPSRLIMGAYDVRPLDITLCSAIEQRGINGATAVTSCSQFLADEVAGKLGVRRAIPVVTNGLDIPWFDATTEHVDVHAKYELPRRPLTIVFTGRMERRKGIHLMPEIARAVLERHDVNLVLAGADLFGYVANTLRPSLDGLTLKGSLHWLGALPLGDLRPVVNAADIFLLPSTWENCPYSCLEAMAAGKAIVCTNQGGMPELITHGANGLLATLDDAGSFVAAIEQLIADPALRDRLGRAARARVVAAHAHTHVAQQAVGIYRRLAARSA
jgi:glycosyltransferase involved in cell wall biosynthesis